MQTESAPLASALPDPNPRKFLIATLNGTASYVLAYYLAWGLHQGAKLRTSRYYNLLGAWDLSCISYSLADGERWHGAIVAVNGVGPAVYLTLGMGAFLWFW